LGLISGNEKKIAVRASPLFTARRPCGRQKAGLAWSAILC